MKRYFPSNYTGKLIEQDVNNVAEFEEYGCTMPNDYVDWDTLSSDVTVYKLTKEEMEMYLKGELEL